MVFIHITPFVPRKLFLFFGVASFLSCISCFAQPVYFAVSATPYDNQMLRVHTVFHGARTAQNPGVSLRLVNRWIENLRAIPYGFSTEWKTPSEVESATAADCKGKSVALYEKMRSAGASNFR